MNFKHNSYCLTHAISMVPRRFRDNQSIKIYGARNEEKTISDQGVVYSPPTVGHVVGDTRTYDIDTVIGVGLNGCQQFDNPQIAYHGTPFENFSQIKDANFQLSAEFYGAVWTELAYGKGVYLTPSFTMAQMYGADGREGNLQDNHNNEYGCILVFKCVVDAAQIEYKAPTGYFKLVDGWKHGELEWIIRDKKFCQIQEVVFSYFKKSPQNQ